MRHGKLHWRKHFVTLHVATACIVALSLLGSAASPDQETGMRGHRNGAEMKQARATERMHPTRGGGDS